MNKLISLKEIERITAGDKLVVKEFLSVYVKEASGQLEKLKTSAAEKKWEELKKVAHKMKSSLFLLGMLTHRDIAEKLERTAGNDVAETKKKSDILFKAYKAAIEEVKAELKKRS